VRHQLLPFGMIELRAEELPKLIAEEKALQAWKELLIWGGYPEVVLMCSDLNLSPIDIIAIYSYRRH